MMNGDLRFNLYCICSMNQLSGRHIIILFLLLNLTTAATSQTLWTHQESAPAYKGKQDDIYFINPDMGWYVNGSGKIYRTRDGGTNWALEFEKPGTYFRCVGFIDSLNGFAGNIGTDYFPGVSDTVPIYKTTDGGKTWSSIVYKGPVIKGVCAIDILKEPFINAGVLDYKFHIIAGGRVGSPAFILRSDDAGKTWSSSDLNKYCAFILDIKFFTPNEGLVFAGCGKDLEKTHACILYTDNGGKTWQKKYESKRPYEITWKASFPTRKTGYVTIQSYDPDSTVAQRYVAKTTNGGKKWKEIKLDADYSCQEFGIGFTDENTGWVGTMKTGYETHDGGATWKKVAMGKAVNKIRLLKTPSGFVGYAIGKDIYKMEIKR